MNNFPCKWCGKVHNQNQVTCNTRDVKEYKKERGNFEINTRRVRK